MGYLIRALKGATFFEIIRQADNINDIRPLLRSMSERQVMIATTAFMLVERNKPASSDDPVSDRDAAIAVLKLVFDEVWSFDM